MPEQKNSYYLEYSVDQDCFHIDSMEKIQTMNIELCRRRLNNGYVIIAGPFNNLEDACKFSKEYEYLYSQTHKDRDAKYIKEQEICG